jgi:serine protease Do
MPLARVLVFIMAAALALAPAAAFAPDMARALPDIVAPLLKAVVNISVLKHPGSDPNDAPDQVTPDRALGSGFVITADGYIVTNQHVVEGGYDVSVAFADGSTFPATVVASNERPDIALLKIDAGKPLPFVVFGDSDALRIGESVLAIGNPLGLSSSVSAGIVSALNRDIDQTMIDDFVQTDAAINHGNSGGPLFNLKGEVIGVNWALYAPGTQSGSSGLGLAIPANDAAWVVGEMRKHGRLRIGFLGLRMQQISPAIQAVLNLPSRDGGIVTGVLPSGPAARAGIREGDVVLALDGRAPRDVRALLRALGINPPGSTITLAIWRHGAIDTVKVTLVEWPRNMFDPAGPSPPKPSPRQISPDLGLALTIADQTLLRKSAFYMGEPGVAITGVAANSPAADLRLSPGNVILRVNDQRVASPAEVWTALDAARAEGKSAVLMLIEINGVPHWMVMPMKSR